MGPVWPKPPRLTLGVPAAASQALLSFPNVAQARSCCSAGPMCSGGFGNIQDIRLGLAEAVLVPTQLCGCRPPRTPALPWGWYGPALLVPHVPWRALLPCGGRGGGAAAPGSHARLRAQGPGLPCVADPTWPGPVGASSPSSAVSCPSRPPRTVVTVKRAKAAEGLKGL